MSNNEPDYKDNLFFNPQTEWKGTALDALGKKHARFSYRLLQSKIEENEKPKEELSREIYKTAEAYCYVEELKELLKECREKLKYCTRETYELITKIDEVLK